jgi:hypothetical protein
MQRVTEFPTPVHSNSTLVKGRFRSFLKRNGTLLLCCSIAFQFHTGARETERIVFTLHSRFFLTSPAKINEKNTFGKYNSVASLTKPEAEFREASNASDHE